MEKPYPEVAREYVEGEDQRKTTGDKKEGTSSHSTGIFLGDRREKQ